MNVLVAYATSFGSTRRIAEEIASRLAGHRIEAEAVPVDAITTLDGYDAVVVGSAVHDMAWLPAAQSFVREHETDLANRLVWLFSVSSVGDSSSFFGDRVAGIMRHMRNEPKTIATIRSRVRPRGHRNFAGAVERSHWNLAGHLFLRVFGGTYGDHLDHDDVRRWADGIAAELDAPEGASS